MTETAYEWGKRHGSCPEALMRRKALGSDKTQADWWRECPRGDWLLWQLDRLSPDDRAALRPAIDRAAEAIVRRAVANHALNCGIAAVEAWAAKWLSGEDRSGAAAWAAAWAAAGEAAGEAAGDAELAKQADDIRAEIPDWPGGEI